MIVSVCSGADLKDGLVVLGFCAAAGWGIDPAVGAGVCVFAVGADVAGVDPGMSAAANAFSFGREPEVDDGVFAEKSPVVLPFLGLTSLVDSDANFDA